ncbi:MAG TPA: proton-conducting transporter membrane subunit [bacterium]|nr:proton-conducting transporter membrane subunit [bacterium]
MILPYFVVIPLLAAFLISLISGKKDNWAIILAIISILSLLIISIVGFIHALDNNVLYELSDWDIPYTICLVMDSFTAFMLVIIHLIALTSLIFSISYIRHLSRSWKYYSLFLLLIAGMNGVVLTGDIFNLFVFMEIALFSAYALVAYGNRSEEFEASFKYAVMGSISSTLILIGVGITYSAFSTLTLGKIAEMVPETSPAVVNWLRAIFVVGFGLKAAIIPFHAWLPDAHSSAPAPISSMLSGVLIKALGVYVIIRLFFSVFGMPATFSILFKVLGSLSILVASFLAINQWDIKRLLAYSSISQIGFIVLALGIHTPLAVMGAVFHILNHAIFKGLLFYNSGSVEMYLGTRDLRKMGRLSKLMPVTSATAMIGTLSVSGMPIFNGFFSKLLIILAAIQAGATYSAIIAVLGSVLTLAYFLKFQRYGFLGNDEPSPEGPKVSLGMKTAMITLAVLCVLTSILIIPGIRENVLTPVVDDIINKAGYISLVLGG